MRVTFGMTKNALISNITRQSEKLLHSQDLVSTGKAVNTPSDDPIAAGRILSYRSKLSSIGQYETNIAAGKTWIETSDTTLETVQSLLSDAIDATGDATSDNLDTVKTAKQELEAIYDQMLDLTNTQVSGNYIFSGHQTKTAPFGDTVKLKGGSSEDITFGLAADATEVTIEIYSDAGTLVRTLTPAELGTCSAGVNTVTWDGLDDGGSPCDDGEYTFSVSAADGAGVIVADYPAYKGDDGDLKVKVGKSTILSVERNGGDVFTGILRTLRELITTYESGDFDSSTISSYRDSLNESFDTLEAFRSDQAATYKMIETNEDMLAKLKLNIAGALGNIEDVDTETATIELKTQQTAYDACLEAISSILDEGTLIDHMA